jgi:hypothetical protein
MSRRREREREALCYRSIYFSCRDRHASAVQCNKERESLISTVRNMGALSLKSLRFAEKNAILY